MHLKTPKTQKKLNGWKRYKKGERLVTGNICQILNLVITSFMREKDSKQDILFLLSPCWKSNGMMVTEISRWKGNLVDTKDRQIVTCSNIVILKLMKTSKP